MAVLIEMASPELVTAAADIGLVVFDVDGVMTDGKFTLDEAGNESKTFNTQDGYGIRRLIESGIRVAVITGRSSGAVTARTAELGIEHVFQGCRDKHAAITGLLSTLGTEQKQAAAVGDDMPDLPMFEATGVAFAPANAVAAVASRADLITRRPGGDGAVREIADFILAAREAR
ncbi:MAG: HAD hydrolase family protein, partial [Pseudomonadota bacterium]